MNRTISFKVLIAFLTAGGFLHYAVAQCTSSAFRCTNGACFRKSDFCDQRFDCKDRSDEIYCNIDSSVVCPPGWIRCPNGRRCILSHWICDGVTDCEEISEEGNCDSLSCSPSHFECIYGPCIPRFWFCNGKVDCEDFSDEQYCNILPGTSCPDEWILCPSENKCIPLYWKCDGLIDCFGMTEESNCGNITLNHFHNTAAGITDNSAALTRDINAAKLKVKSWFLRRRKPGSGIDQWGSQVHRIAVALHLADNSTFSHGNITGQEIRYELSIKLLQRLEKDKKMDSQELALYIHAMLSACLNPKDFYGYDLVNKLRRNVETDGNYTNPLLILALCNAGDIMSAKDVERVTAAYDSNHRPFWTDLKALAAMALSCISSRSSVHVDDSILKVMLLELKRYQSENGTVDNFRTTALVIQALYIHGSYKNDFNMTLAMKAIIESLKETKSLLEAYFVLPVLNGKSLLNVSSRHCKKESTAEEEALQKVLDMDGEMLTVMYSVWMGDDIKLARMWSLKMVINSTIYDAIETVAKIDNRQKVEYNVVDGKPYVSTLGGKEDDPEMGMFWFVYLKTLTSDKDPKMVEESPVDVKLQPDQEIILWYRRGLWTVQNQMQEPVTSS